MSIKAVLFDLDNTMYLRKEVHQNGLEAVCNYLKSQKLVSNFKDFIQDYEQANKIVKIRTEKQAASHNKLLYFQVMLELKKVWSPTLSMKLYNLYWDTYLDGMELEEGFLDFLDLLKKNNIKSAIVTDLTSHIQHRKLMTLGLDNRFEFMLTSEEAGCEKPSQEIFNYALEKLECQVEETCFIGDDYKKDIEGSANIGMKSFWFTPHEGLELAHEFSEKIVKFSNFKDIYEYFK